MTITVKCQCGAKLKAKEKMAGKRVACPKCKQPLTIPAAAAAPSADPLGLEPVEDAADPLAGGDLLGGPLTENDPLGGDLLDGAPLDGAPLDGAPLGGSALDPLSGDLGELSAMESGSPLGGGSTFNSGSSLNAGGLGKPQQSAAKKDEGGGSNTMLIVAGIGGGVLVLAILGGVAAMLMSGGNSDTTVASATNQEPASGNQNGGGPPDENASPGNTNPDPGNASANGGAAGATNNGPPGSPAQGGPAQGGAGNGFSGPGNHPDAPGDGFVGAGGPDEFSGNSSDGFQGTEFGPAGPGGPNGPGPNGAGPGGPNASGGRQPNGPRNDNGLGMTFCYMLPGYFQVGRSASKRVTISRPSWLGETEVTRAQWKKVMKTEPWKGKSRVEGDNYPATHISWLDAKNFCSRMNDVERKQGRLKGNELLYRLPSVTESFYVYLKNKESAYTHRAIVLEDHAWTSKNSGGSMHEVKTKKPNNWGMYDTLGNVAEWTEDGFTSKAQINRAIEPGESPFQWFASSDPNAQLHVFRGGSFQDSANGESRPAKAANESAENIGFRVALAPPLRPTNQPERPAAPPAEKPWFVLSNLEIQEDADTYTLTANWQLVAGYAPPEQFIVYVESRYPSKRLLSGLKKAGEPLSGDKGQVEVVLPKASANGPQIFWSLIIGDVDDGPVSGYASGRIFNSSSSSAPQRLSADEMDKRDRERVKAIQLR